MARKKRRKPVAALPRLTFRPEHVVIEKTFQYVHILGQRFELTDLLDTLEAAEGCGNIQITNKAMIEMLKRIGVLEYEGSCRSGVGAALGPNAPELIEKLQQRLTRVEEADDAKRELMRE